MKPQLTDEQLEALRQDSIHERFIAGSDVRMLIKEIRACESQVEEIQKTLEQIANTEWHPNADLVNVEIAYEMRALAMEALQSLKEDKP